MEYSMFLFIFFFTHTLSNFIDHRIIQESSGLFVWDIPEQWETYPTYTRYDVSGGESSSSTSDISELDFGISDLGIPLLGIVEQNTSTSDFVENNLKPDTNSVYIILKKHSMFILSLYYWVGENSSKLKRINAASSFAFILMEEIPRKIPHANVKQILRREGMEDEIMLRLFNLPFSYGRKIKKNAKLYRVAGHEKFFFMEIPPKYRNLNASDSFVLDKYYEVLVWNSSGADERKQEAAKVFGQYLIHNSSRLRYVECNILVATENKEDEMPTEKFKERFLSLIRQSKQPFSFPQNEVTYTDENLCRMRNNQVKLYEYTGIDEINEIKIRERPLQLTHFKSVNAYVMTDDGCGSTYVYLGSGAKFSQVRDSLVKAEIYSLSLNVKDAWQRIYVIREGHNLPVYFLMYFY